jgi:hypothetical protein
MRGIATGIPAIGMGLAMALLSGCQVYLHDEGLQKQTAAALAAYKEADVPGAMKATIAAQEKFDAQMLESIVAEDAAARDREIAELLETGDRDALLGKITARLRALGGATKLEPKDWKNGLVALQLTRLQLAGNARIVSLMARHYREAGGKDFKECKEGLVFPTTGDANLKKASDNLKLACEAWLPINAVILTQACDRILGPNSILGDVCGQLDEARRLIDADELEAEELKANLAAAKKALADERKAGASEDRIEEKLMEFKAALDKADKLFTELGANDSRPSAALAAIEFRESSLCDVLFAGSGKSCGGDKVDDKAKETNEALIGIVAGFSKVIGPAPRTDALTIALSHQNGLQRAVQARLNGRIAQRTLLQAEQKALVQEVEYLLQAQSALDKPDLKLIAKACSSDGLLSATRPKSCTGRVALANALTAYNLSWADGRTAARIANARVTMQITMTSLQVDQVTAAARDEILMTALTGLDAFGQGGVKTETIAGLLQALGIAAIAHGVN